MFACKSLPTDKSYIVSVVECYAQEISSNSEPAPSKIPLPVQAPKSIGKFTRRIHPEFKPDSKANRILNY